jgi:hypothetical protein
MGPDHAGSSRTPLRLARRTRPSGSPGYVPALSGLLPPSPAPPGSGCPQLQRPAATGRRQRSLTSARITAPHGAHGPRPSHHPRTAASILPIAMPNPVSSQRENHQRPNETVLMPRTRQAGNDIPAAISSPGQPAGARSVFRAPEGRVPWEGQCSPAGGYQAPSLPYRARLALIRDGPLEIERASSDQVTPSRSSEVRPGTADESFEGQQVRGSRLSGQAVPGASGVSRRPGGGEDRPRGRRNASGSG